MPRPTGPTEMRHYLCVAGLAASIISTAAIAASKPIKHDAVLRAALEEIAAGHESDHLAPEAARPLRRELDLYLGDALKKLGALTSLYGMGNVEPATPLIIRRSFRSML